MNTDKVFKPLLAVGMQYINEQVPNLPEGGKAMIENVLDSFIERRIDFKKAARQFNIMIGTQNPLERIDAILRVDDEPIPEPIRKPFFNGRKKTQTWTTFEDQRILAGIHRYGLERWTNVSLFVGNGRTRAQCSQRWYRGLDPRISKVLWSEEEDEKLILGVQEYGNKCWKKVSSFVGNRSDAQCRYRYKQIKDGNANHTIKRRPSQLPNVTTIQLPNIMEQPQHVEEHTSMQKLPSIETFVREINLLPDHLKFNLTPILL